MTEPISFPALSASAQPQLLDALPDPLLLLDAQERVLFANRAATRQLACKSGEPLTALSAVLGQPTVAWIQGARRSKTGGRSRRTAAQLRDGRSAALELSAVDDGLWLLSLRMQPRGPAADVLPLPAQANSVRELLQACFALACPVFLQDGQFRLLAVNDRFIEFSGYPREQLIGLDPLMLDPAEDQAQTLAWRQTLTHGDADAAQSATCERRMIDAQGQERWVRVLAQVLCDDAGQTLHLSLLQDVSDEHRLRDEVERAQREIEHWLDLSTVGLVMFDAQGLIVRSNPVFGQLVGRVPVALSDAEPGLGELLGWAPEGLHPELLTGAAVQERHGSVLLGTVQRPLRALVRAIEPTPGQRRFIAVVEDRSVEDERDLARLEMGALMDTAGVGVATFEPSRGWRQSAQGAIDSGKTAGLQAISRELVDPPSLAEYERLQQALKQGTRAEVRYAVRHPELGLRWLLTRVEPGQLRSGQPTTSVVTLDVTEQEQAQRDNEQLLRELSTILDSTSAGIAYLRGDLLVRCNQRFESMLGLRGGQAAGARLVQLFAGHEIARPVIENSLAALRTHNVFETEFKAGDGNAWYSLSVRRTAAGAEIEAVAVLTDISRLKAQQIELERLLRDRELMFNLSDVGIVYVRNGRIERANEAFASLTGQAVAELTRLQYADLFENAQAWQQYRETDYPQLCLQGRWSGERRLPRRDGSLLWAQVNERLVDEANPDAGLICSFVNVEERHRVRSSLVLQTERTRAILDSVLVGIITVGDHGIEWMNRSARRMFGGELADFVGEPISTVATPEPDHPLRRTHYLNELIEGQAEAFECRLKARDGREFWVVGNAVLTGRESTGRQLTFALLDIERRRQAEVRIAQAQASLQRIIETAPLAIGLFDAKSLRLVQLNQMAAMFIGRLLGDALDRPLQALFPPDEVPVFESDMRQALTTQEVLRREYRRGQGSEARIWDARYVSLSTVAGQAPEQLLLVASDVTEQRVADEARFEAAIAQRDMLVREVHHRIKNNLQGVAGLMQQIAQRRPEVASVISEAIGQVQAIAQVYGLQVGVAGPLRVKALIESIAASVRRIFGRPIQVQVLGETALRWALPEAEAIPIALTINELLTNAIKHSREGEVVCSLICEETGIRIEMANQGRLAEGFDLAHVPSGVSGLGLVRALLPRRSATLTIAQQGASVVACIALVPPGVKLLENS